MRKQDNSAATPTRISFGFKEGLMFGLGLAVPILTLCLVLLGILLVIP